MNKTNYETVAQTAPRFILRFNVLVIEFDTKNTAKAFSYSL